MNGQVLNFSVDTNSGVITGSDGNRYNFTGAGWREQDNPARGMSVDFDVDGGNAFSIYRDIDATVPAPEPAPAAWPAARAPAAALPMGAKSKVVAALLALFLGGLGVHKFYLGRAGAGITMSVLTGIGWFSIFSGTLIVVTRTYTILGIPMLYLGFLSYMLLGVLIIFPISIIAFIESIIYLTKSDEAFHQTYVVGRKSWF